MVDNTYLYIGLFVIVLGFVIWFFKLTNLVAGFNSLSKEEKENVNTKKLLNNFRNVMLLMGIGYIAAFFSLNYYANESVATFLFFASSIGGTIYLVATSNGDHYKK